MKTKIATLIVLASIFGFTQVSQATELVNTSPLCYLQNGGYVSVGQYEAAEEGCTEGARVINMLGNNKVIVQSKCYRSSATDTDCPGYVFKVVTKVLVIP